MTSLDKDLRFALSPLVARGVYALLFARRREIAAAIASGFDEVPVVARVLGVERAEAQEQIAYLRGLGMLGPGMAFVFGTGRRSRAAAPSVPDSAAPAPSDLDDLRARLRAFEGSRRGLAAELGCSESALRAFEAGRKGIGPSLAAALGAYLVRTSCVPEVRTSCVPEVRTSECVPAPQGTHSGTHSEVRTAGTQSGTQPLSPSDSLSLLTPVASSELPKATEADAAEGVGSGEREPAEAVRTAECVPGTHPASDAGTHEAGTHDATGTHPAGTQSALSLDGAPASKRRARRAARPAAADPVPPEGTAARRIYEAIVTDVALAPITAGPGDLAMRLAALCDGTSVDAAGAVISAGAWLLRNPGAWKDGASGLLRWVKRDADRARSVPSPVVGAAREPSSPARIDWQGRRVVGAAGLPPGSVWEKTRAEFEAEEDALFAESYARTQPRVRR